MKKILIIISIFLLSVVCYGQEGKGYYLKYSAGPKWNLLKLEDYNDRDFTFNKEFNAAPVATFFNEIGFGIPLTHFAYIETGVSWNRYYYQERLVNKYARQPFELQLPDIAFTNWQIPLRLRTSFNLVNQRLFLLWNIGIGDLLTIWNTHKKINYETQHTFTNTGIIYTGIANYGLQETMSISTSHSHSTHPLYIEFGGGLEFFLAKNISINVAVTYALSSPDNNLFSSYSSVKLQSGNTGNDSQGYSAEQSILFIQTTVGFQYYFNKKLSSLILPFKQ